MTSELNFPITYLPKPPFSVEHEDAVIRSKMEDGYIHTRPRSTRARKKYSIKWDARNKEYKDVNTFFSTTTKQGSLPFNIAFETLPSGEGIENARIVFLEEVLFASPPKFIYDGLGKWTIECEFVEV